MTNLSGSLSYKKDSNSFFINETGTNDGWVPLPISINAKDLSKDDLKSLAQRLGGGSKYQIYVDIDNPNASDLKDNTGTSRLTPFKSLERALLEVARRSFRTSEQEIRLGVDGDIFERYTINLAPGEYIIKNTPSGFASISNYDDYQVASNLILRNKDWIVAESFAKTSGVSGETIESLLSDLSSWVLDLASCLSSLSNGRILFSARDFLNSDKTIICSNPNAVPNNYFVGIYDSVEIRQQAILALTELKEKAIDSAKNLGFVTDSNYTINPTDPLQIQIYNKITEFVDTLINTLQCALDPRFSNVDSFGVSSTFPEDIEPPKDFYTYFNHPSNSGIILPRGVSIIGADLRKVIIRPEYVPDYDDPITERGSIFKMTGANFFSGFTIKDKKGYLKSHHLLTAFEFSTELELESYYSKIRLAFSDKIIYHRAQDAANLLEKNLEWVSRKSIPPIVQTSEINYAMILEGEIFYIIKAIISDLRDLDKQNIFNLGKRFHLSHINPITDSDEKLIAQTFYKSALDNVKIHIRDAINNEANVAEGGVVDEGIIIDASPGARCADVVSAIYSYVDILKNHIDGLYSGDINASEFISSDVDPFVFENSIVIDYDNDGSVISDPNIINGVVGASPYIFSASLRSEYGMCGIEGDGSKVRGLKSYLAAQFTIISLQKDDNAFKIDDSEVGGRRYKGSKKTDSEPDFRHYGYKVSNGAYSQLVSCFCICPAIHYWADSGGEFSITNSTSNFGDISLYSEKYLPISYPQDRGLQLIGVIKPKYLNYLANPQNYFANANNFTLGNISQFIVITPDLTQIEEEDQNRFALEAKIILDIDASNILDIFPNLENSDNLNNVYIASLFTNPITGTRERFAKIKSITRRNALNVTEIIIENLNGSWPIFAQDVEFGVLPKPDFDSSVIGRQVYIKRFRDNRSAIDRQYRLVLAHQRTGINESIGVKRNPTIHYTITQDNIAESSQPFNLENNRECFHIIKAPIIDDISIYTNTIDENIKSLYEFYDLKIAANRANDLGQIEFEVDLDYNSNLGIELDVDPLDPNISNAIDKDTTSKINIQNLLNLIGVTGVDLAITTDRFINLLSWDRVLKLNKPTIIRCSGQTWEYMGYYNYFTGLPFAQNSKVGKNLSSALKKLLRIEKTQTYLLGGRIYATGMDEEGNSYMGNTFQDLKTGETEEIVRGSSVEVLEALNESNIPSSLIFTSLSIGGNNLGETATVFIQEANPVEITSSVITLKGTTIDFTDAVLQNFPIPQVLGWEVADW